MPAVFADIDASVAAALHEPPLCRFRHAMPPYAIRDATPLFTHARDYAATAAAATSFTPLPMMPFRHYAVDGQP